MQSAGERDVVLVVGRGHETTLTDDGAPVPFDDVAVAREALEQSTRDLVTEQAS